jgi:hypothetical protein
MEAAPVIVRVRWTWGGSQIVKATSCSSIDEVLSSRGFKVRSPSRICVAHKGKLIDPAFSFKYYNIANGDVLVCHEKTFHLKVAKSPRSDLARWSEIAKYANALQAKLEDQAFDQWEIRSGLSRMMDELLTEDEPGAQEEGNDQFQECQRWAFTKKDSEEDWVL